MRDKHTGSFGFSASLLALAGLAFMMTGHTQHAGAADQVYNMPPTPVSQKIAPERSGMIASGQDTAAIQALIKSQLEAIKKRDAETAYALTTGAFHKKYDTAGEFLTGMRFHFRPLYNHESFRFLDQSETQTGALIQRLEVEYSHGMAPTVVIYRLQRDDEGEWRVDSFSIVDTDEGQPI